MIIKKKLFLSLFSGLFHEYVKGVGLSKFYFAFDNVYFIIKKFAM